MNTKGTKFLAVLAVMAMAFTAFAIVDTPVDDGADADTLYLHGTIDKNQECTTANVIVDDDLIVKEGAILTIKTGVNFEIPEGVTLTIDGKYTGDESSMTGAIAALVIEPGATVTIDGKLVIGEYGTLYYTAGELITDADDKLMPIKDQPLFIVNGSVEIVKGGSAVLDCAKDNSTPIAYTEDTFNAITFAAGSALTVSSVGGISAISGTIVLEAGATANINGYIGTITELPSNIYKAKETPANGELEVVSCDLQKFITDEDVFCGDLKISAPSGAGYVKNVISTFDFSVTSNVFDAWTGTAGFEKKVKVIEDTLNVMMNVKNGETIKVKSETDDDTYRTMKDIDDADAIFVAGSVVLKGESKLTTGKLSFVSGTFKVDEGAVLSVAKEAELKIKSKAWLFVEGAMDIAHVDTAGPTCNLSFTGVLYIDGGEVVITDKSATPAIASALITELANPLDIRGAYFTSESAKGEAVLTICEIEDAFTAAALDDEIGKIYVSGLQMSNYHPDIMTEEFAAYTILADLEVWDDLTICFYDYVIIDYDVTLTIAEGGFVDENSYGDVLIRGAIFDNTCSVSVLDKKSENVDFWYSVIISDKAGNYEVLTSFANAMKTAVAGDEVEIVKDAIIDTEVTIPEGVIVTQAETALPSGDVDIVIVDGGKLINKGILDLTEGYLVFNTFDNLNGYDPVKVKDTADYGKYFINENIVIDDHSFKLVKYAGTSIPIYISGFYAKGQIIEEDKDQFYLLSSEAVQTYSDLLEYVVVFGEVVEDEMAFVAGDLAKDSSAEKLVIYVPTGTDFTVGKLNLDNYCALVAGMKLDYVTNNEYTSTGFTGAVTFNTTAGTTTVLFDEQGFFILDVSEEEEEVGVITTVVLQAYMLHDFEIVSGEVELTESNGMVIVDGTLLVDSSAILTIPEATTVWGLNPLDQDALPVEDEYNLIVDGVLNFTDGTGSSAVFYMNILINGDLNVYNTGSTTVSEGPFSGKTINGTTFIGSLVSVLGTIYVCDVEDEEATFVLLDTLMFIGIDAIEYADKADAKMPWTYVDANGLTTISGEIILDSYEYEPLILNYGYDLSAATIIDGTTGKDAVSTEFIVDGMPLATVYAMKGNAVAMDAKVLPVYEPGYTLDKKDGNSWFTDVDMKKAANGKNIGDVDAVFGALKSKEVMIRVSTGVGITLYIDGLKAETGVIKKIGTYTVEAIVDPGYQSDVKIMFNGQEVKDGKFTITPELADEFAMEYDELSYEEMYGNNYIPLTAMGEVTPIPEPTPGMSITEILLIVLVILIAIMAVIVALRLNRS